MVAEKSVAIVLKVVDFSETSCVVTLMTRDFGKVSALAKGARRPKSPFEAALDVLSVCRVVFLRKSGDSLNLLTEAKLDQRFRAASSSLEKLYAAYYVIELLQKLTDELDPQIELFDLARRTIELLDEKQTCPTEQTILRFQMRMLSCLGHAPSLRNCVDCGSQVTGKRIPFGMNHGGVLCSGCREGKRNIVSVSQAAIENLVGYSSSRETTNYATTNYKTTNYATTNYATTTYATKVCEENDELPIGEMRGLADQYITHLLGNKPRMLRYFRSGKFN